MVQMTLPDVYYICHGSVSTVKSCETGCDFTHYS